MTQFVIAMLAVVLFVPAEVNSNLWAQTQRGENCPHKNAGQSHSDHEALMSRSEQGMGFSQTNTTHHFLLKPDGGVIAVTANDSQDTASRDQIRMHLTHIAHAFANGDFDIPMFVHDQTPPGVPLMKRLAKRIRYQFQETANGSEVMITSDSRDAVNAIHDFLVFQIREHHTGDPTSLEKSTPIDYSTPSDMF